MSIHKFQCGHPTCRQYTLGDQGSVGFNKDRALLYDAADAMFEALEQSAVALAETLPYVGGRQAAAIKVQISANAAALHKAKYGDET